MGVSDMAPIHLNDDVALFREALTYTAAETGFIARLIEKDYFCTVLLQYMAEERYGLVFRGGTCLAKVHSGFYRLSEDLDFVIPTPVDASRAERGRRVTASKEAVASLGKHLPDLRVTTALTGANDSAQYNAALGYTSVLSSQEETIKIEVSLREPLLRPSIRGGAQTLLLDPISGSPLLSALPVPCLSREEAMAEKLRAALSRRDVVIRDFYDVDHAARRLTLRVLDPEFVDLVRVKLAMPGNEAVDVSAARLTALRRQLEAQLKPVLRARDFAEFDLERAFATVASVAAALG